jgi:hypothetical protein
LSPYPASHAIISVLSAFSAGDNDEVPLPRGLRRLAWIAGSTALAGVVALVAILMLATPDPRSFASSPAVTGGPAPKVIDGLTTLAFTSGSGEDVQLTLSTTAGPVNFWSGVNLGSSVPGHNPGELAMTAEDYRRWLDQMGQAGVRVLRVYTILPPYFYEEFRGHNERNPDSPLYLLHGIYLPDESYIKTGDLLADSITDSFREEIQDASAAVSGDLERAPQPGRASGTWTADVSAWLAGWIIGAELDPVAIDETDRANQDYPEFSGTYFVSASDTGQTTPTERWLAERMDDLATAEAGRGRSSPIAFVNWPTTDPLEHPAEPIDIEDLVGIDANHVRPTAAWPGGSFASYHAYPYYPDFLRYEAAYQEPLPNGSTDPYAAYLLDLKRHHAQVDLPMMVTEFGVPSSLGSAHYGTNGRDQGFHTEPEALQMDADMLRMFKDIGLAGGLLFIWVDEWFKFTWNTIQRTLAVDPERRALWLDPLTNEEFFGAVAMDPVPIEPRTYYEAPEGITSVAAAKDAAYLRLTTKFDDEPEEPVVYAFDVVPGGLAPPGARTDAGTADIAIIYDYNAGTMTAYVREEINPILLDRVKPEDMPPAEFPGWSLQRLTANRAYPAVNGFPERPAEFYEIGRMIEGNMNPDDADYDSRATWSWNRRTLDMRIPWGMLNLSDPSSKTAFVPVNGAAEAVPVERIGLTIDTATQPPIALEIDWEPWQKAEYRERIKPGMLALSQALRDTAQLTPSTVPSESASS